MLLQLFRIHFQVDVHLVAIVELADGLRIALATIELRIHLVIDVRRQRGKTINTILAHDVRLHSTGSGVGEVNHGIGDWTILPIRYPAHHEPAIVTLLFERRCKGAKTDQQQRQGDD